MSTKNTPEATEILLATGDQVGHIQDLVVKQLRALPRDEAQDIITNGGVFQAAFGKTLDDVRGKLTGMIIRRVKVNRGRTPQQTIDATNRRQYTDKAVVATMPVGQGDEEVEMIYFAVGKWISDDNLAAEYEARGLEPDPEAQAADNAADPAFADSNPNGTQWKLPGGGWGYLAFYRDYDERYVGVVRDDRDWSDSWSFGGRRKKALGS